MSQKAMAENGKDGPRASCNDDEEGRRGISGSQVPIPIPNDNRSASRKRNRGGLTGEGGMAM